MCWKLTYKYNKVSSIMIFPFNWIKWSSRLPWLELLSFSQVLWQGTSTLVEIYSVEWYSVKYKVSYVFVLLLLSRLVFFLKNKLGLLQLSFLASCALFEDFIILSFINIIVNQSYHRNKRVKKGGKSKRKKVWKYGKSSSFKITYIPVYFYLTAYS